MANRYPEDSSILYLQSTHRSSVVINENIDEALSVKRTDNLLWRLSMEGFIHERVYNYLSYIGFSGVLQCGFRIIDHHLITALVERWRRETHTFHFRSGEATITLQDVSIIWGLKVDGLPVTGVDYSHKVAEWQQICYEWLGFVPEAHYIRGGHLSMTALNLHCRASPVNDMSSELEVVLYTRCIALMIIGGILLPDYQGGSVRLMYLQLIQNFNVASTYSWGSAVLAFLYRELCNATRIEKRMIVGPLYILQIWAWSRIQCMNPDRDGLCLHAPVVFPVPPYGARWKTVFCHTHTPTHAVRIIRHCLDNMQSHEFNWSIYNPEDADVNAIITLYNNDIWRSVCPLICFELVEMHRPNRVMRQFGMRQSIPAPAVDGDNLHSITRTGHRNLCWATYHAGAIAAWNRRYENIATSPACHGSRTTDGDYVQWYKRITIPVLSPIVQGIGFHPQTDEYMDMRNFSAPSIDSTHSSMRFEDIEASSGSSMHDLSRGRYSAGVHTTLPQDDFHATGVSGLIDMTGHSPQFDMAGSSSAYDVAGPSGAFDHVGPSGVYDLAGPSGVYDLPDYRTPDPMDTLNFTDLLNQNVPGHASYAYPGLHISSPIPFQGYSDSQSDGNEESELTPVVTRIATQENVPRRGQRDRRRRHCGTGGRV